jgi:hypothetical protein
MTEPRDFDTEIATAKGAVFAARQTASNAHRVAVDAVAEWFAPYAEVVARMNAESQHEVSTANGGAAAKALRTVVRETDWAAQARDVFLSKVFLLHNIEDPSRNDLAAASRVQPRNPWEKNGAVVEWEKAPLGSMVAHLLRLLSDLGYKPRIYSPPLYTTWGTVSNLPPEVADKLDDFAKATRDLLVRYGEVAKLQTEQGQTAARALWDDE